MLGTFVLSAGYYDAYYARAQKVRTLLVRDFERAFEACDALVAPVCPTAAFRLGEKAHDPLGMYLTDVCTTAVNPAGGPAPSGAGGLPGGAPGGGGGAVRGGPRHPGGGGGARARAGGGEGGGSVKGAGGRAACLLRARGGGRGASAARGRAPAGPGVWRSGSASPRASTGG